MDERHVYTVFDVLCCWPFMAALELGSYDGASSTAFVEAMNQDLLFNVTFCDVHITPNLERVADGTHLVCNFSCLPSWTLLEGDTPYDFILVDANHDLDSVSKELTHILRRQPLCVMAHDTNATRMGYPKAEGAQHLADTLRQHPAYQGKCIEDAVVRDGEETHRGLFFATTNQDLYDKARAIFNNRCPVIDAPEATDSPATAGAAPVQLPRRMAIGGALSH